MKITRLTPVYADKYLYVEVETDTGLTGTGELGTWGHYEAAAAAIEKFATYLVGQDPRHIETHWNVMQRFGHFRGAAINGAISGIDIALWDIKGQALGVPIYELLGGPVRSRARVYAHVWAPTAQQMVETALLRKQQGYTAIGHVNPFLDEDRSTSYFKTHARKLEDGVAVVAELREKLGPDVDLCLEIHRRLTPAEAITFAAEIAPFRPMFYEDPIPPSSPEAMAHVAANIGIPVATGERFVSIYEFKSHLERRAMEYARTCVCMCGGITGARKVAALAEAFNVQVVPHNPLSPVSLLACLHLDAAIPNFAIQEFPLDHEEVNTLNGQRFVDWTPQVTDGMVEMPTGPGLGGALTAAARDTPKTFRKIMMRRHLDGSVVEQ
jgi:galactonate dehydratase